MFAGWLGYEVIIGLIMVFLSEADYRRWDLLMQIILYTFPL
ncbi:hypothetical protein NEIELOOT_02352 [Neisseria elongata subsp. glycolytica ATCC 29315]|uniref:Uncharacterized protein n=1 Tax=Neisseria elongata subsp. glycolytica ATCC 29315 TaxID=546263 RepID=D4DTE7_NEIEG|nr:hypothetical protein NEIELOOT_02352 [Neisseria elongata subsp. glycolytica ATCC 29315]